MVTTRRSTRSYKKARIEEQDTSSFATQSINVSDDDFQEPIVSAVRQTRSSVKRRTRSSNVYIDMDITPSSSRQESVVTESGDSDESSIAQSNTTLPTSVASSARDSESEMERIKPIKSRKMMMSINWKILKILKQLLLLTILIAVAVAVVMMMIFLIWTILNLRKTKLLLLGGSVLPREEDKESQR